MTRLHGRASRPTLALCEPVTYEAVARGVNVAFTPLESLLRS